MEIINWFKDMIDSESPVSSKRFCGVSGWLASICIITYCTVLMILAPTIMEVFIVSVVALLGVDSFTSIWKKSKLIKTEYENENENENK